MSHQTSISRVRETKKRNFKCHTKFPFPEVKGEKQRYNRLPKRKEINRYLILLGYDIQH